MSWKFEITVCTSSVEDVSKCQVNIMQFQQTNKQTDLLNNNVENNNITKHLTYKIISSVSDWLRGIEKRYISVPKHHIKPLTPNDPYRGRTSSLTSKRCILYIRSTNIGTQYFKHGITSLFFSSKFSLFHNSNVYGSCIIHILYTVCARIKEK